MHDLGVTTNNLMGVTLVTMAGEVVEIGGPWSDAAGLDLLGVICGSEGQLGVVTEATLRILPKPEGARPVLIGFAVVATLAAFPGNLGKSWSWFLSVTIISGGSPRKSP